LSTTDLPDIETHNTQIENALDFLISNKSSFAILDKGRTNEERSCIWVEKGHFYGMGYIAAEVGITELTEIKDFVTPYKSNDYIMQLIYGFVERYPGKVRRDGLNS
jgi:DNA polymerase-3 subunit epsilon